MNRDRDVLGRRMTRAVAGSDRHRISMTFVAGIRPRFPAGAARNLVVDRIMTQSVWQATNRHINRLIVRVTC